jgi:hypothetical protein
MSGRVLQHPDFVIPIRDNRLDVDAMRGHPQVGPQLERAWLALLSTLEAASSSPDPQL